MSTQDTPGPRRSWAAYSMIALESLFWSFMVLTAISCGLNWIDGHPGLALPVSVQLQLITLPPLATGVIVGLWKGIRYWRAQV